MTSLYDAISEIADVDSLIQGAAHESEVLEYKTASTPFDDKGKSEVAKDVSAMANSLGGVIIYGVATDPVVKSLPHHIEGIHPKCIAIFEQVINSQVRPPIEGIRKKLIPPGAPQVMVVEVPQSENPPHQSLYDKKYYRRSGTECLPMEHDLVAMHFGRRLGPLLELRLKPIGSPDRFEGDPPMSNEAILRLLIENKGKRIARYVLALFMLPADSHLKINRGSDNLMSLDHLHPGRQARQYSEALGVIHPFNARQITDLRLSLSRELVERHAEEPFISWSIYADEMAPQTGSATLRDLGWA